MWIIFSQVEELEAIIKWLERWRKRWGQLAGTSKLGDRVRKNDKLAPVIILTADPFSRS